MRSREDMYTIQHCCWRLKGLAATTGPRIHLQFDELCVLTAHVDELHEILTPDMSMDLRFDFSV